MRTIVPEFTLGRKLIYASNKKCVRVREKETLFNQNWRMGNGKKKRVSTNRK